MSVLPAPAGRPVAALLDAAVGSCPGCQVHLPARRAGLVRTARTTP